MDYLSIIFSVVLVVLTLVLTVVGVQLVLVLMQVRKTLQKVNTTIDSASAKFEQIVTPLQNLGGAAAGLRTGLRVFETFVGWLNRNRDDK